MTDDEAQIRAFLEQMKDAHKDQVEGVQLPDGTVDHVKALMREGDVDTIVFMLKLGYLMGLQAGFAIVHGADDDDEDSGRDPSGPLEA